MADNQAVPYPTLGAAYPVKNVAYPVAPPVPAFKPNVDVSSEVESVEEDSQAPAPSIIGQTAQVATEAPKFFPLVPTSSSKFVSADAAPIVESSVQPIDTTFDQQTVQPEAEWAAEDNIGESLAIELEQEQEQEQEQAVEAENLFDISPSLTHEPQTNSIVLESIPDVLTSSEAFSEAGEILVTGSIELPTITGEISLANESPEADSADAADSASVTISTVAPVRAPSVINSKAQLGVLPSKRRRSQGQLMAMLTLGLLIVTVGTLYVMASILGIIK